MKSLSQITQQLKLNVWNGLKIESNQSIKDGTSAQGVSEAIDWDLVDEALEEAYNSGYDEGKTFGLTEGYSQGQADAEIEFEQRENI